jgi:hypothetical protein
VLASGANFWSKLLRWRENFLILDHNKTNEEGLKCNKDDGRE